MAKSKPSRAFLEALQQDKKRRGDDTPGGGFKTPEWFFKNAPAGAPEGGPGPAAAAPIPVATMPLSIPTIAAKRTYRYVWWHGAVAGGVLICVVAGAMVFGRGQQPPKHSAATDAIKSAPPQSSALDVPTDRPAAVRPPSPIAVTPQPQVADPVQSAARPKGVETAAPESTSRVIGMNYVVVQAYETDAKANEAADALRKSGIGCTVEKIPAYNSRFVLVVGTTAFARTGTTEYQQYLARIMQVSDKYAGNSKWKKFAPNAYKWK